MLDMLPRLAQFLYTKTALVVIPDYSVPKLGEIAMDYGTPVITLIHVVCCQKRDEE